MLHVFRMIGANLKVFRSVVLPIHVFVMNLFALVKRSSNSGLGNDDVFKDVSLRVGPRVRREKDFSVSILNDKRLLSVGSRAVGRTKRWCFVVRNELGTAVFADKWLYSGVFCWRLRRGVSKLQIVFSAIAASEVFVMALINRAVLALPCWLSLLRKSSPSLPQAITSGIAKRHFCRSPNFALNNFAAASAMFSVHKSDYSIRADGNHYSFEYQGVK